MPRIERTAEIVWEGNVARGIGSISGQTGAFTSLPFSLPSRIGKPDGKTSPEELLAAAHGGCITMSLASEFVTAGTPPGRIEVTCLIVMDEVAGAGHEIVASHVDAVVAAPGLDEAGLLAAVEKADAGCPFSRMLKKAGVAVQVAAQLSAA